MKRHTKSLIAIITDAIGEPTSGCEIGVWDGCNSELLLRRFRSLHLLMVDRYKAYTEAERNNADRRIGDQNQDAMFSALKTAWTRTEFAAERRTILIGDSVHSSSFVADYSLDFIFIDAHHAYESVKCDMQCWFSKIRRGGIMSGDDYGGRGDRIGLFGIKRAVDDFAAEYGCQIKTMPGNVWWCVK